MTALSGKRILLVIGGGIAAYKSLDLIRRLRERGASVRCIMTAGAQQFVTPLAASAISGQRTHTDLFDREDEADIGHIRLARDADAIVVAPATANLLAKMAGGHADDLASTVLLATTLPILIAPAMNVRMWLHPATQRNLATLQADGVAVVGPNEGPMAEAETGPGRMAEPLEIVAAAEALFGARSGPLAGKRVLVTGAGGSIGSELCRQICTLNPARLILVGQGENSIFEIEQELVRDYGFAATALVGDIKDRERMEEIFLHERPTVVFHAAAHKHVPLMEANPVEAVRNNVLGTLQVAVAAARHGVKKFVLISTDKAVNPSSVMGTTKRIAELIVLGWPSLRASGTDFRAVRFGNVLGSVGSVVPLFRSRSPRAGR